MLPGDLHFKPFRFLQAGDISRFPEHGHDDCRCFVCWKLSLDKVAGFQRNAIYRLHQETVEAMYGIKAKGFGHVASLNLCEILPADQRATAFNCAVIRSAIPMAHSDYHNLLTIYNLSIMEPRA